MISNELLTEIINVSNEGQLLNKKLIRKLVKEIISNTDKITKRKFKLVRFENSDIFCAKANTNEGKLIISLETCYEDVNEYKKATILEKNLHLLGTIIHEIMHLQEPYKIKLNNVEGKLINLSNYQTNYFKNGDVNYDTYYTNPSEKIAYALSYKKLLEILINYPGFITKYPKEFANINNEYIERLTYGYKKIGNGRYNVPLIDFTSALNKKRLLRKVNYKLQRTRNIRKIRKMSIEDRFMYGLPITKRKAKILEKKYIILKEE